MAEQQDLFQVSDVMDAMGDFQVSRQSVSNTLADLVASGQLLRNGTRRYTYYALPTKSNALVHKETRKLLNNDTLSDYETFNELLTTSELLRKLPENVIGILQYSFSEMMNNAIEHSESKSIKVELFKDAGNMIFTIRDYGVGVFNSIKNTFGLDSDLDAIQELLKGKTTTAPKAHSGEGIFFTSKIASRFVLESFGTRLIIDNTIHDIFVEDVRSKKGTLVTFSIARNSKNRLDVLFTDFYSDPESFAFDKTVITVKLFTMGTVYVSRSQAKRLVANLDKKFKVILLDYQKVPSIGQAFADEIYRVFRQHHPDIDILSINTNKNIDFMIKRAEATGGYS
ncbi:MAG: DUF4325 domain-containing protein [Coriobacteriales bacterium]|nr:DUF4325 domain-containing protein [Coriobacteriales bacterium]